MENIRTGIQHRKETRKVQSQKTLILPSLCLTLSILCQLGTPLVAAQCPTPSFQPPTVFPAAQGILVPADYDLDGNIDLAVGNLILYGDGHGGLKTGATMRNVRSMATADFGGVTPPISGVNNAAPELIAESTFDPTVIVVGLGFGRRENDPFQTIFRGWVARSVPLSTIAADLTGDGISDLVIGYGRPTANFDPYSHRLWFIIGTSMVPNWQQTSGGPTFEHPFHDPVALATGDFDDDGRTELLALSGEANSLTEFKYVNQQFVSEGVSVSGVPTAMAVADLNGDGLLDAVVTTESGDVVSLLGTGKVVGSAQFNPTFKQVAKVSVGGNLASIALGDVNGDRRTDALVVDRTGRRVIALLGNGGGEFAPSSPITTRYELPFSVVLADFNHDGKLDIAIGNLSSDNVEVHLNTCETASIDIEITGMEVTQGIQDLNNSVVLVADRPTFVRLHVRAGVPIDRVTAQLSRTDENGTVLERPIWPTNPGGSITVKANPDRKLLADSFLFELPPSWTSSGTVLLTASVNPNHLPVETTFANNVMSRNVTFQPTNPLKIELIKVRHHEGPGRGTSCGQDVEPTDKDLDKVESALRRELPASKFVFTRRANVWDSGLTLDCAINIAPGVETGMVLKALEAAYASAPLDRIRLAIFARDFIGGAANDIPGWFAVVGWAATLESSAHEIGHTLGRYHIASPSTPPCKATSQPVGLDSRYPYLPGGLIGGPVSDPERFMGFDRGDASLLPWPLPRKVVPPTVGDRMGYCEESWPSDYTWTGLREGINAKFSPNDPTGDFLRITGSVDSLQTRVSNLSAVRLSSVGAIFPSLPGKWHLRLLGGSGEVLSDYLFTPREDVHGQQIQISETIPFSSGTRNVAIINPCGSTIGTISVSAHSPIVGEVKLSSGPVLPSSGPVTLSWSASDPDGNPLLTDLLWSRDGAKTFDSMAYGVTGSSYTFEASGLAGTGGQAIGVLRILVRDPVLTAMADFSGIIAPGSAPRLRIVAPYNGQRFVRGQTLVLRAIASDVEDGVLDEAVSWHSNRDGILGSGGNVSARLSLGSHILTAQVADSSGNITSVTTTCQVYDILPPGTPPIAVAGSDQQVLEGATVVLDGRGSKGEDGDSLTYAWRMVEAPPHLQGLTLSGSGPIATFLAPDNGTYRFELMVWNGQQNSSTAMIKVDVANVNPSVKILSPTAGATLKTGEVLINARFIDPGLLDTHACIITWDEDSVITETPGTISESAQTCSATKILSPGNYLVRVTVRDNVGGEGVDSVQLVVTDPHAAALRE